MHFYRTVDASVSVDGSHRWGGESRQLMAR